MPKRGTLPQIVKEEGTKNNKRDKTDQIAIATNEVIEYVPPLIVRMRIHYSIEETSVPVVKTGVIINGCAYSGVNQSHVAESFYAACTSMPSHRPVAVVEYSVSGLPITVRTLTPTKTVLRLTGQIGIISFYSTAGTSWEPQAAKLAIDPEFFNSLLYAAVKKPDAPFKIVQVWVTKKKLDKILQTKKTSRNQTQVMAEKKDLVLKKSVQHSTQWQRDYSQTMWNVNTCTY